MSYATRVASETETEETSFFCVYPQEKDRMETNSMQQQQYEYTVVVYSVDGMKNIKSDLRANKHDTWY